MRASANIRPNRLVQLGDTFLKALGIVLLGYALCGRGFAYLGIGPLFLGEMCLLLGICAFLVDGRAARIFSSPSAISLLAFMGWGAACTFPYIPEYQVDALRDAALWGYGTFAFLVGGIICARPVRLVETMQRYQTFVYIFLAMVLLVWFNIRLGGPTVSTRGGPFPYIKGGEMMVHLAGALILYMQFGLNQWRPVWIALLGLSSLVGGLFSRGGAVAYLMAMSFVMFLQPANRRGWSIVGAVFVLALLLAISGLEIDMGKRRSLSFAQIVQNFDSVMGSGDAENLSSTKEWRLNWWRTIIDYTFNGKYFWMGKGFGINLADDDGFQVAAEGLLRSPHNGHMTVLARSGVVGLGLWLCVLGTWFVGMMRSFLRAKRRNDGMWARLFLFLMAFLIAFLVEASFDVYLEGPMGGIWFWTVYGVGMAARWIYVRYPDLLDVEPQGQIVEEPQPRTPEGPSTLPAGSAAFAERNMI